MTRRSTKTVTPLSVDKTLKNSVLPVESDTPLTDNKQKF
jgi:hypothetical protein